MKIGILTRRYGYNMGSSLQAFAIAEVVKRMGHEVEIINYDESSAHWRWKVRPFIENILYKIRGLLPDRKRDYLNRRNRQIYRFQNFESKYFPLTDKFIRTADELRSLSEYYDKIIVGSDQIWSPFLFDSNYLGGFLGESERKKIIPYAPSLGISYIDYVSDEEKTLLKSLSFLSCREHEGAEIIKEITGKDVIEVLDPTLILSSEIWHSMAVEHPVAGIPDRYILTYFLGEHVDNKEIQHKASHLNLKVVNVNMFNRPNDIIADIDAKDLGPGEFVNLVAKADFIFTDSFHATVFSWIFNKEFTVFERFKSTDIITIVR